MSTMNELDDPRVCGKGTLQVQGTGALVALALAATVAFAAPAAAQDGGWTRMLAPQLERYHQPEVNAVHFFNRHIGWAVGGHARDARGQNQETFVFRTDDGGVSWERLTFYDGQRRVPDFVGIGFADARNGWLLTAGSLVLRTTNGGDTWNPVEPLPRGSGRTLLVIGPDAIVVGSTSTNGRQINITTDGGRSWRNSTVAPNGRANVDDVAFVAPGRFFAVIASAMQNAGGIYRSDDGGRSWSAVVEGEQPLHTIAFSESGRNGVAAGAGVAYATRDGGDSWQRVAAAGSRYAAHFADEDRVLAFGAGPSLLLSEDGGRTWRPGPAPELRSAAFVDVQMVDAGWWLVAGGRGAYDLFRYEDPAVGARMAGGAVTLPQATRNRDGTALPPGVYDFALSHSGLDHEFRLSLREPADGVETGVEPGEGSGENGELEPHQYACDPCEGYFPTDVGYDRHELPEGQDAAPLFDLSLQPSGPGVALVLEAAAGPPRDLRLGLAALGGSVGSDLEGGAAPPSLYRIRLRHAIDLFGGERR